VVHVKKEGMIQDFGISWRIIFKSSQRRISATVSVHKLYPDLAGKIKSIDE